MESHFILLDQVMSLIDFAEENDIDPALGILLDALSKLASALDLRQPRRIDTNVVELATFSKGVIPSPKHGSRSFAGVPVGLPTAQLVTDGCSCV